MPETSVTQERVRPPNPKKEALAALERVERNIKKGGFRGNPVGAINFSKELAEVDGIREFFINKEISIRLSPNVSISVKRNPRENDPNIRSYYTIYPTAGFYSSSSESPEKFAYKGMREWIKLTASEEKALGNLNSKDIVKAFKTAIKSA